MQCSVLISLSSTSGNKSLRFAGWNSENTDTQGLKCSFCSASTELHWKKGNCSSATRYRKLKSGRTNLKPISFHITENWCSELKLHKTSHEQMQGTLSWTAVFRKVKKKSNTKTQDVNWENFWDLAFVCKARFPDRYILHALETQLHPLPCTLPTSLVQTSTLRKCTGKQDRWKSSLSTLQWQHTVVLAVPGCQS